MAAFSPLLELLRGFTAWKELLNQKTLQEGFRLPVLTPRERRLYIDFSRRKAHLSLMST